MRESGDIDVRSIPGEVSHSLAVFAAVAAQIVETRAIPHERVGEPVDD